MKKAPSHPREYERLAALKALELLDTEPESEFDEVTLLASQICHTPIALFCLVDEKRQWFKAQVGLKVKETPRDFAFCAHAILQDEVFEIPNSKLDERFHDNPLVTGEPQVEFYAGIAVRDPSTGYPIGTLCVIDHIPRELSAKQRQCLVALRNQIERLLTLKSEKVETAKLLEKVERLNQHKSRLVECAGIASWELVYKSQKVVCDKRWSKILNEDDLPTNMDWRERLHPDERDVVLNSLEKALNGEQEIFAEVHRLCLANGRWIWVLNRGKVIERDTEGQPQRFLATCMDVSTFKQIEDLSREIQKIANMGAWSLDLETQKTTWTPQVYEIHGLGSEIHTDLVMGLSYYLEEDRHRLSQMIQDCRELGRSFRERFQFQAADQKKKWVEVSGHAVRDGLGRIKTIKGTFQDVTARVEEEQILERNRIQAAQASKLASLGEMSAGVAHEINNPLAILNGSLDLLGRYRGDEEKYNERISLMKKSVARIVKIVNGLRKFSRTGGAEQLRPFSLKAIVDETLVLMQHQLTRKGVELRLDLQCDGRIDCDPIEIEQVLINLMNNSIEAVEGCEQKWISLSVVEQDELMVMKVTDSGSGIPRDIADKIYQPFFTTKAVGQGTGLGLSICRGILDRHQAQIRLDNRAEHTTFVVSFKPAGWALSRKAVA